MLKFFQAPPDAAKEFRMMSHRVDVRTKKKSEEHKKKNKVTVDCGNLNVGNNRELWKPLPKQADFNLDPRSLFPRVNPEDKAFHSSAVLRGQYNENSRWKRVSLSKRISQADQGSELSIIPQGLVNAMAFPRSTLSGGGR
ncbi:hypothetical protein K3495_g7769 [Podosphaera aphanis]|nr:hypothetical protein K3495_g7769 [Podosphaera aphanis]